MTRRRDLKRRVRDRQAQTGESYMTALRHVQAQVHDLDAEPRPPDLPGLPISVVELVELSELAEAIGLRARVTMAPDLADQLHVSDALLQIRRALHRPELALMREVLIDGAARYHALEIEDVLRFNRRVEQLRPGVSDSGKMAALYLEGSRGRVLVVLWLSLPPPFALGSRPARLLITSHTGWRLPWAR